jgi:uncharacterized damage-inducible protein DinB
MQFDLDLGTDILKRTPYILRAWLQDLPYAWVYSNVGGETWSPFDVVGHLIHGERTDWIPRLKLILADDGIREFEPFDRLAQFEVNRCRSLEELLRTFEELRRSNLAVLESLDLKPSDFAREGRHPELGVVTLEQLLAAWVVHDLDHLGQIAGVMARQYQEAAGPWGAYMGILGSTPQ